MVPRNSGLDVDAPRSSLANKGPLSSGPNFCVVFFVFCVTLFVSLFLKRAVFSG